MVGGRRGGGAFPAEKCFPCSSQDSIRRRAGAQKLSNERQHAQPGPEVLTGQRVTNGRGGVRALGRCCTLPRGSGKPSQGSEEVGLVGAITGDSSWEREEAVARDSRWDAVWRGGGLAWVARLVTEKTRCPNGP